MKLYTSFSFELHLVSFIRQYGNRNVLRELKVQKDCLKRWSFWLKTSGTYEVGGEKLVVRTRPEFRYNYVVFLHHSYSRILKRASVEKRSALLLLFLCLLFHSFVLLLHFVICDCKIVCLFLAQNC